MKPFSLSSLAGLSPALRLTWLPGALLMAAVIVTAGCENKAVGRPCELLVDGGVAKTTVNPQALECPTRICVQPAVDTDISDSVDTVALCSAECSKDGAKRVWTRSFRLFRPRQRS